MLLIAYIALALITLAAIVLLKTYTHIPAKELKRRARQGDDLAKLLFRAAAYEESLSILLWAIIGISSAAFFVVLSHAVEGWLALLGSLALVWLGFAWLPYTRVTIVSTTMARIATPPLAWLLRHLYPVLSRFADYTRRYRRITFHSGLYEKEDLLDLLDRQKSQIDSRITDEELSIARNALTFGDKIVRDIMTPRKVSLMVNADEHIGPILLDELHKSGHSRFPVYSGNKDHIVGTLYLHDISSAKASGLVRDVMQDKVYFLHDEEPLSDTLQAFLKTRHHLFVVTNNFEDIIGIVSLEDVLEQIIGKPIVDEFDQYDDLRAVAQRVAKKEHREHEDAQEVLE